MEDSCQKYLQQAYDLAEKLLSLADEGDAARQDVGCGIVFGTMRDCGYKLQALVAKEIEAHKLKETSSPDEKATANDRTSR